MTDDGQGWHYYRHSSLSVRSQLALPEWNECSADGAPKEADVSIRLIESAEDQIEEQLPAGGPDHIAFSVADTGRWAVRNGCEIRVEPARDADPRALRLFTLGSAWGALGYQRGLAMLHGSAVTQGNGVVLFGGTQEQGKSTMAAAMIARGAKLVSDDLSRVDTDETSRAVIYPSSRRLKLWQGAIDQFGMRDRVIARDLFREEKFHCAVDATAHQDPLQLSAIILLEWGDEVSLEPLSGGGAVRAVLQDTCYRPEMLEVMERTGEQAAIVARIVGGTSVFRLTRPRDFAKLSEVCELVEAL